MKGRARDEELAKLLRKQNRGRGTRLHRLLRTRESLRGKPLGKLVKARIAALKRMSKKRAASPATV